MQLPIYQIVSFTDKLFSGNSAAVIPLKSWLDDSIMQQIAEENKVSETVFVVNNGEIPEIRWFTPIVELDICGHATIAVAYVMKHFLEINADHYSFLSRSGILEVIVAEDWYTLILPTDSYVANIAPPALLEGLPFVSLKEVYKSKTDYMVVLESEHELMSLKPDINALSTIPARGIMVTAPGDEVDFVLRFFAPQVGISEDPVTGSAFTMLMPYWSERLGKSKFIVKQLSARGGELRSEFKGENKVAISGQAKLYMKGEIVID